MSVYQFEKPMDSHGATTVPPRPRVNQTQDKEFLAEVRSTRRKKP